MRFALRAGYVLSVLLVCAGQAIAQDAGSHVLARVVGLVNAGMDFTGPPLDGALVDLIGADRIVGSTRTGTDGSFSLTEIRAGDYILRIRHIGYVIHRQSIAVRDSVVRLRVLMPSADVARDSLMRMEFRRKLALARGRPRHWNCRVDSAEFRMARAEALQRFFGDGAQPDGTPRRRDEFVRGFRQVTQAECDRLAVALDREHGLIEDSIVVYRVGDRLWLPAFGENGAIADLSGKILAFFVTTD